MNRPNAPQPFARHSTPKFFRPEIEDTYYEAQPPRVLLPQQQHFFTQRIPTVPTPATYSASLFEAPRKEAPIQIPKENRPLHVENIHQTIIQINNCIQVQQQQQEVAQLVTPVAGQQVVARGGDIDIREEEIFILELQKRLICMQECLNEVKHHDTPDQRRKYETQRGAFEDFVRYRRPRTAERRQQFAENMEVMPANAPVQVSPENSNEAWNLLAAKYLKNTPNGSILHDICKNQPKLL
jgi:hypothetical protein